LVVSSRPTPFVRYPCGYGTLDGFLAIGEQAAELDPVKAARAVKKFARARGEKALA
jgi:hypothetical protein